MFDCPAKIRRGVERVGGEDNIETVRRIALGQRILADVEDAEAKKLECRKLVLGALQVAERLQHEIFVARVTSRKGEVKVTVSMGVAMLDGQTHTIEDLLHHADRALYAAKQAGRNCVRYIPPL